MNFLASLFIITVIVCTIFRIIVECKKDSGSKRPRINYFYWFMMDDLTNEDNDIIDKF